MCRSPCYHDIGCAGVIFQIWKAFRVIVTEESLGFSVTMAVLALEALFCDIDTEKPARFCGTMRGAQQNYVFDTPTCNRRTPVTFLREKCCRYLGISLHLLRFHWKSVAGGISVRCSDSARRRFPATQKYFLSFLSKAMKMNSMAVKPHMEEPP